jgi:hypothetical protein
MGIERGEHAVDRRFDEHRVVGLLDIVGADALENVPEQIELTIELGIGRVRRVCARYVEHGRGAGETRHQEKSPEHEVGLAHHSCTF